MPKLKNILNISKQTLERRIQLVKPGIRPSEQTNNIERSSELPFVSNAPVSIPNHFQPTIDMHFSGYDSEEETLSDFEPDEEDINENTFISFLQNWTLEFNVTRNAVSALLKFLKKNGHSFLPSDSRTLLKTPKTREVLDMNPGQYCHIGLKVALDVFLSTLTIIPDKLVLNFNIDGVPISRSSQSGFWTILVKFLHVQSSIYTIGVYHGYKKPENFSNFLTPFTNELKLLMENYAYKDIPVKIEIGAFICDAPARAACTGSKGHNGYYGCGRCSQNGEFINYRMTFPDFDAPLRTNLSFRNRENEEHHLHTTPLESLNLDMVRQFPLEYLHTVCLGAVKKLLKMWVSGDLHSRIQNKNVESISISKLGCDLPGNRTRGKFDFVTIALAFLTFTHFLLDFGIFVFRRDYL